MQNPNSVAANYIRNKPNWVVVNGSSANLWTKYHCDLIWTWEIDYSLLNTSKHLVNYIKNDYVIENKDFFHKQLLMFDQSNLYNFNSTFFIPPSYLIPLEIPEITQDELEFCKLPDSGVYIKKPVNLNAGRGIEMLWNIRKIKNMIY